MECKVQEFYHEFNHRIHGLLGFYFDHSLVGKMNSQFEQDLFKFPDTPVIGLKKFHTRFYNFFMNANFDATNALVDDMERVLKVIQLNSYWNSLEEIWNIVGFANISDHVYINKMSDLDLLETGFIHHYSDLSDNENSVDTSNKEIIRSETRLDFFKKFFKRNDSEFWEQVIKIINQPLQKTLKFPKETGDAPDNYPTPKAWKYLLQLHDLKSNGFDYIDIFVYEKKDAEKISRKIILRK